MKKDDDDLLSLHAVWNQSCDEPEEEAAKPKKKLFENSASRVLQQCSVIQPFDKQASFSQQQNTKSGFKHANINRKSSSRDVIFDNQRQGRNSGHAYVQESTKNRYKGNSERNSKTFKKEDRENKSNVRDMKPMSFLTLRDLVQKPSNEILLTISSKNLGFMMLLDQKDIGIDKMAYALIALGKSCLSDLHKNFATMVTNLCSKTKFLLNSIQRYLVSLRKNSVQPYHLESLFYLTTFLYKFQLTMPSSASEVVSILLPLLKVTCEKFLNGHELFDKVITKLTEIDEENEYYIKHHTPNEVKKAAKHELLQLLEPPENYRSVPVLPNADDVHSPSSFLRPNIVQGKYIDTEHYLDVQYRLLREDYVKPLRDGIAEYLRLKKTGKSFKNCRDIRIYNDVHIVKQDFVSGGMVHIAEFSRETFSKVKWEYSKRFLSGSLLCLSSDDFQTMLFASVARRIPEELKKGLLLIRFEKITDEVISLSPLRSFVVIETSAYFEAYRYNLKAMHELNEEIMPFKKYIVETENTVDKPHYLSYSTTFDMRPLLIPLDKQFIKHVTSISDLTSVDYEYPPNISNAAKSVRVLNDSCWPTESELNLDHSQYVALKAAITREFAIIQGPPGTGKTYIGLRIVQLLLHNMDKWWQKNSNSLPILVVCYTNHALDQFLEGLMLFTNNIVRIGGRGNNEAVSQFQLNNLRSLAITKKEIPRHITSSMWQKNHDLKSLKLEIDAINHSMEKALSVLFGENELQSYIPAFQFESLKTIKDDPLFQELELKDDGHLIHDWLGIRSRIGGFGNFAEQPEEVVHEKADNTSDPNTSDPNTSAEQEIEIEDAGGVVEADIEYIEAQRDIDSEEFAGVSFNIELQEKDLILNDDSEWKIQGGEKRLQKQIKRYLRYCQALDECTAVKIKNIWHLELPLRWQLYKFWLQKYIEAKQKDCLHFQMQLKQQFQEVCEIRTEGDLFILQNAHIVGMTTTGAAKYRDIVVRLNPQILIVEEAAEILEGHTITSLAPKTQHMILIGDHQQLRPSPTVHMLSVHYDLDISLFERMIKNNMDCFRLSIQHRMRPDVADLIVPHIYSDLKNHETVTKYENIKGINKNVFFVTHNFSERQENDSKSKVNTHEAKFLIKLCKYIILQGYDPSQITVLTTYSGQLFVLKKLVTGILCKVRFTVVDNFQGEENDIILISFVRSNDEGEIGFLKISNRVCVSLSRAKKGLYCIGNFELLAEKSELWKNIVETLQQKQCIGPSLQLMCQNHPGVCNVVSNETDFESVPEGGCTRTCEYRLSCGHTCSMMCHPYDMAHEHVRCQKPCTKTCSEGHQCKKKCYEVCGSCVHLVEKKMSYCGHTIQIQCYMQNSEVKCYQKCNKMLPCGHACTNQCSASCIIVCKEVTKIKSSVCGHEVSIECCYRNDLKTLLRKCSHPCSVVLECGHICKGTCSMCHQSRLHIACRQPCKRILVCGHECKSPCSKSCPSCTHSCENKCTHSKCPKTCGEPCDECTEPCEWFCRHQQCTHPCGQYCNRIPCNEPCPELLPCGHGCIGFCGEPCPKECRECNGDVVKEIFFGTEEDENARYVCLEDCGHIFEISGLNQWMKADYDGNNQIQMKCCPRCKTVIRTNLRFGNVVKECLNKIEKVKRITFGNVTRNTKMQEDLYKTVHEIYNSGFINDARFLSIFRIWVKVLSSKKCRSIQEITTMENICKAFLELISALSTNKKLTHIQQNSSVKNKMDALADFVLDSKNWLVAFIEDEFLQASEQQLHQLTWEVHRLKLCNKLIKFTYKHGIPEHNSDFKDLLSLLTTYTAFGENDIKAFSTSFQKLAQTCGFAIINLSDMEKQSILKAMNLTKGHWYQCPNGHVYCITECGSAVQEGRCNECNEKIGGTSYSLLDTNRTVAALNWTGLTA